MLSRILVIATLFAAAAAAQRGGGGGGGGGGMPGVGGTDAGGWGSAHAHYQSPFERFAAKLKLDNRQREAIEPVVDAAKEAMAPAMQKLLDARKSLALAVLDNKNPEEIGKLTAAYTSLSAQTKAMEATAFGKICALLKPNQQSKAVPNFAMMAQLLQPEIIAGPPAGGQQGHWAGGHGGQR